MDESILDTIKKLLGIDPEETPFDTDIIVFINNALLALNQIGVGETMTVTSSKDIWSDFINDEALLGAAQMYVYAKVRILFDPPSGGLLTALQDSMRESEWRLNIQADPWDSN